MKQRSKTIDRAVRLYLFMLRYWVENGYTPTVREMCGALGVSSTATAQHYLNILIQWKWIERRAGIRTVGLIRVSERGMSRAQVAALAERYAWWEA